MSEQVNSPSHYNKGSVECIEGIKSSLSREAYLGFLQGNALKYVWRAREKGNPVQDIEKATWYLDRLRRELKESYSKDQMDLLESLESGDPLEDLDELLGGNNGN